MLPFPAMKGEESYYAAIPAEKVEELHSTPPAVKGGESDYAAVPAEKDEGLQRSELHFAATPGRKEHSHYINTPAGDSIYADIQADEEEVDYDIVRDVNKKRSHSITVPAACEEKELEYVVVNQVDREESNYAANIVTQEE